MTSFLQQQLLKLSAPQTNVYNEKHKKPSILFDASESKAYNRDDYYDLGKSGFDTLVEVDAKFAQYSHLFSRESKDVQRFVADVESNRALDEALEGFLLMVSPYYIKLVPAMKAMEWLLQRYCIHEMNVDAVMMCILPYYDTPKFIETFKVLDIEQVGKSGEQNKWQWLRNAKRSGEVLVSSIFYDRWQYSAAFRQFCNSYILKMLKVYDCEDLCLPAINFYVTVVMGGLSLIGNRHKKTKQLLASDDHVYSVVRILHVLVKSPFEQLVSGAYLILMQLAVTVQLQPDLWNEIITLLVKTARPEVCSQLCHCLVLITHQQYVVELSPAVLQLLQQSSCPVLQQLIEEHRDSRKVAAWLVAYAGGHVKWCVERHAQDLTALQGHLLQMVAHVTQFMLQPLEAYAVIRNTVESVVRCNTHLPPSELSQWLPTVLEKLELGFPDGYDRAVRYFAAVVTTPDGEKFQEVHSILDQSSSRKLAQSLALTNTLESVVVAQAGAAASVQAMGVARQALEEALQQQAGGCGDQQRTLALAHDLLDKSIHAVRLYPVAKSSKSKTVRRESAMSDESWWVRLAAVEGRIAWDAVREVARACLPVITVTEATEYILKDDYAEATPEQWSVLLSIKLLRLLVFKQNKASDVLDSVLKRLGGEKQQLRLLSLVWGWQPHQPHQHLMEPAVQLWCLQKGLSLARSSSADDSLLAWMVSSHEQVVPSLLSALTGCHEDPDEQSRVREAAMALVSHLWEAKGASLRQANFKAVLGLLAENAAAICVDSRTDHLLGAVYQRCSQQPSLLRTLVSAAALPSQPPHLAGVILFALSQLQDKAVLEGLLPSIKAQLQVIEAGGAPNTPASSTMDSSASPAHRLEAGPSMLLYWSLVHLNSASVAVLDTDLGWEVFTAGLRCTAEAIVLEGKLWSPQTVLARQVTKHKLLQAIDSSSLSGRMWSVMATAAAGIAVSARAADRLQRALRDVTLHARFVLDQLHQLQLVTVATSIRAAQQKRIKLEQQKGGRKGRRLSGSLKKGASSSTKSEADDTGAPFELPTNWRSLQLLLELLCEVRCVQEPWLLVEPLCTCMHEALGLGLGLAERLIQQVLACLHHLISLALEQPPQHTELRTVLQVNVESVVQCVRQSADPYTHRWALLILSLAAKIQPESVLHNLMTIFTFMGEGLLQRDDKFSFQVIEKTVTSLVPILVQHSSNSAEVCSLVQVFVDALPDIAIHRRLMVFSLLTTALKPDTHLWLVDMLIVKSYIVHGVSRLPDDLASSGGEQAAGGRRMPREISFALQLTEQFEVRQQVSAARHVLALLTALPTSVGAEYSKNWPPLNAQCSVLDLNKLSAKQLRHFIYTSVGFLGQLFVSENFIATLLPVSESKEDEDVEQLQAAYEELLSTVSAYLSVVSEQMADTASDDPLAHKFWCSLQRKLVEVLEAICALLQPELLLRVICSLLQSPLAPVRLRATDLLRTRLLPSAAFFSEEHVFILLPFLSLLHELGYSDSESDECRQVALSALHLLLRFVAGSVQPLELMPLLTSSVSLVTQEGASRLLVMQAVLVSAECVGLLQNETVAVLPQLLPALLSFLEPQQRPAAPAPEADHLPLSAATAMYKVVDAVPQFLSRYLDGLLVKMCQVSWLQESQAKESKLCNKLSALATLIREKVDPKTLMPALLKAFRELSDCTTVMVCSSVGILELLGELVNTLNGAALAELRQPLLELLTLALGARQNHRRNAALSPAQVDVLEERAVWAVARVVLRQDEAANLALYASLQEWVDLRDTTPARTSFYRLMEHLASTLQVLFIKARLADQVFGHAIETLSLTVITSKRAEGSKRDIPICQLLKHVLGTLTNIFLHDSVGFTSDARFRQLLDSMLQQVCNTVGGLPHYTERVSQHLRPCLLQLCSAARSDALWADLNKKMLTILRDDMHPQVHATVLMLTQSLIEHLREDWLQPLLLDTLPFVTEALESSHEVVENRARELLAVMTDLMGDAVREQLEV